MQKSMDDWRQSVLMPTAYRVGNSTLRIQTQFVITVAIVGVSFLVLLYALLPYTRHAQLVSDISQHNEHLHHHVVTEGKPCKGQYNATYPLTSPVQTEKGLKYRIALVSDLDTDSLMKNEQFKWVSYLKKGYLTIDISQKKVSLEWDNNIVQLTSTLSQGGRGMELSELVVFDGKLLTFDDRTGVIYEIVENSIIPWILLTDGNGKTTKGFKCEWATVKDDILYVGGLGKEWTTSKGKLLSYDPQWVKKISSNGKVEHIDWRRNYVSVRKVANIDFPGYMIHEAVMWSFIKEKWIFLPRRASFLAYDDKVDEKKGTNYLFQASEDFSQITLSTVGPLIPTHGFSSFKFIPGTSDEVVIALKTEENSGHIATFITVFSLSGEIWLPETDIGSFKYEGIEFI